MKLRTQLQVLVLISGASKAGTCSHASLKRKAQRSKYKNYLHPAALTSSTNVSLSPQVHGLEVQLR
jgi:hypothetical protein